jgi:hypothetical protein
MSREKDCSIPIILPLWLKLKYERMREYEKERSTSDDFVDAVDRHAAAPGGL